MSLFGKFLGILNVLAAFGFVALAVMDWQARHQWTYAVFLHERAIDGLPIDDKEQDSSGNIIVRDLTDKGVTAILGSGSKVKTQVDEVNAVKSALQDKINDSNQLVKNIDGFDISQSPLTAPHQKLAYVLLPLAGTIQEREDLRNAMLGIDAQGKPLNDEGKAKLSESLQARFDQAFSQATLASRNTEERKRAVASLLFNLRDRFEEPVAGANPWDAASFQRVKAVVGLAAMIHTIDDQFTLLQKMIADVGAAKQSDLDYFVKQQRTLIANAKDLADKLRAQKIEQGLQDTELAKQNKLVKAREQEQKALATELGKARTNTSAQLKEQAELEAVMYKALKDLRDLGRTNLDLEKRIRELEDSKK
jgi:tRNA uridine 5-carbamoylmethylation protein Kti12